jgi:UDP-N-acetylmuramate dehydrogenase
LAPIDGNGGITIVCLGEMGYHGPVDTTIRNAGEKINIDDLVRRQVPLAPMCSYKTGGTADFLAQPRNLDELRALVGWAHGKRLPVTILAGGSNVLISDDGVEGLVICTTSMDQHHVRGCIFCTQSGLVLDTAINVAIEHSLSGLEPLGGLPGTVGGAVWGNAGSGGVWISELVEWIDWLDEDGQLRRMHALDNGFSYKCSPFMGKRQIIYEIAFRLIPNKNTSQARLRKEQSRTERMESGQFDFPSAGCVFKNPRGTSAGKLIDEAGLKGLEVGGAKVSDHHANFIVNSSGKATSSDILELSALVAREVSTHSGIDLEREIILIGRW